MPEELDRQIDIDDVLRFGLLPIVWDSAEKAETLAAYAQLYLKEEVQSARDTLPVSMPPSGAFLPSMLLSSSFAIWALSMRITLSSALP